MSDKTLAHLRLVVHVIVLFITTLYCWSSNCFSSFFSRLARPSSWPMRAEFLRHSEVDINGVLPEE
jgi:hypothetical protein